MHYNGWQMQIWSVKSIAALHRVSLFQSTMICLPSRIYLVDEVDFLIQRENDIFSVEVKAETSIESRSLKKYKEKYQNKTKLRIRFSLDNLKLKDDVLNIPCVWQIMRIP